MAKRTSEEAQFGIHPSSVDANLNRQPEEVREKYKANRRRFEADQAAFRKWANAGFVSDGSDEDPEEGYVDGE